MTSNDDEPIGHNEDVRPVAVGPAARDDGGADDVPPVFAPLQGDDAGSAVPAEPGRPVVDRPFEELLVGLSCIALAVSAFLPWYKTAFEANYSGFGSGTWGPVVFFLALAGVAIVGMRRFGVRLAFPVEASFVLEGIGWLSVVGVLLKRYFAPTVGGLKLDTAYGLWVALVAAVLTAVLAGRVSRDMPIVVLPGWLRTSAGKLGAALLVVAIGAGAAFGLVNDAERTPPAGLSGGITNSPKPEQGVPKCLSRLNFPIPAGVTAVSGFSLEQAKTCSALLTSTASIKTLASRFTDSMRRAGWEFESLSGGVPDPSKARVFTIQSPGCGTLSMALDPAAQTAKKGTAAAKKKNIQLLLSESLCRQPTPSAPASN